MGERQSREMHSCKCGRPTGSLCGERWLMQAPRLDPSGPLVVASKLNAFDDHSVVDKLAERPVSQWYPPGLSGPILAHDGQTGS